MKARFLGSIRLQRSLKSSAAVIWESRRILWSKAWTDHLTCVGRYNRASPGLMTHEMMATSDTENAEAGLSKRAK